MKEMIPESEDFWKQSIDDGVLGIVGTTEGRGQRLCCVGNCDVVEVSKERKAWFCNFCCWTCYCYW